MFLCHPLCAFAMTKGSSCCHSRALSAACIDLG